jgi:hypothetical protein
MTEKRGYSSVAALVMARAQKRLAAENDDADLALHAIKLEQGDGSNQAAPIGVAG